MSTVLTTNTALGVTPEWTSESLDALGSTPGSASVDFVVNAFSPKYLGSGTDVNGLLCTQTGVAKIAGIGGTEAFSGLQSFGDTIATRQMQGSICSEGWYIVASYDATNGTRVRYTTNGGTSWSSYVTVSSGVNGSGHMPGLWMSQKTPGLAVVTGFTGSFVGGTGNFEYDFKTATWGSYTNTAGTARVDTVGWRKLSGSDATIAGNRVIFPLNITFNAPTGRMITTYTVSTNASLNTGFGGTSRRIDNTGGGGGDATQTDTYSAQSLGDTTAQCWLQHDNSNTTTISKFRFENVTISPTDAGASAFVTTNYGATWTEISSAATVGYIQPGTYLSGSIEAPYTDASPQRFVYGSMNTSGTYPVPRLHRVSGTTVADISPSYDGKTYGVPHSAPHRRAICISVTDANTAILCGESRNATSGTSVYRVFLTRNLWSAVPAWTPLSDESATVEWRGAYIAGDTSNVAYFLGSNGNFGYWNTSKAAATIFDRKGDSTNSSSAVGLCGI